jgi:staphylococcal nuclease domain-containing protein 1
VLSQPFAFESREYLRGLLVGKTVQFSITHTVSTVTPPREFGLVTFTTPTGEVIDVGLATVKAGWAKVRDNAGKGGAPAEQEEGSRRQQLLDAEEEAKVMARGVWSTSGPVDRTVEYSMPGDPAAFLAQYKGLPLDGELFPCFHPWDG